MEYAVIFIAGKQGSGKTALSEKLWDHFYSIAKEDKSKKAAVRLRFADPLYTAYEEVSEVMRELKITMPEKDGKFLQMLGTWGREVKGQDVWVKVLKQQLERYWLQGSRIFIIDDGRCNNEFDAFPEALRIRLKASEEARKPRTKSWRDTTSHHTETELDAREHEFELVLDTENETREENFKKVLGIIDIKFKEFLS